MINAVAAALQGLPALGSLELSMRRAPPQSTGKVAPGGWGWVACLPPAQLCPPSFLARTPPTLCLSAVEALASGCAGRTQMTALDIHFNVHKCSAPAVPAWRQLSALSGLRRLHISSGMGWEGGAFAEVAAAATALRSLTVTDNAGTGGAGVWGMLATCNSSMHPSGFCCSPCTCMHADNNHQLLPAAVNEQWVASLAQLQQLSQLQLNSCRGLGPECAASLCQLSALTSLKAFRYECVVREEGDTVGRRVILLYTSTWNAGRWR